MKVIFIQNVAKHGKIGDIKEVADGFAMNVLIPKKQALIATPQAIKNLEMEKKTKINKLELTKNLFLQMIKSLEEKLQNKKENQGILEIVGHKHDKGHLFSAVSEQDIVDAIFKLLYISINPSQVILPKEKIKKHGEYQVELKDRESVRKLKILVK